MKTFTFQDGSNSSQEGCSDYDSLDSFGPSPKAASIISKDSDCFKSLVVKKTLDCREAPLRDFNDVQIGSESSLDSERGDLVSGRFNEEVKSVDAGAGLQPESQCESNRSNVLDTGDGLIEEEIVIGG